MKTSDYDYHLPPELIAQQPPPIRGGSRMMVVRAGLGVVADGTVGDLPRWIRSGDRLVVNNTKVLPARVYGSWQDTGGRVELLFLEPSGTDTWDAMYHASRSAREGRIISLDADGSSLCVVTCLPFGRIRVRWQGTGSMDSALDRFGVMPVPPYIQRKADDPATDLLDRERYQTVFARHTGAIAAPTAGLHFSKELLGQLGRDGVGMSEITLHVGPGTFKPVKVEDVDQHTMEAERYEISPETAEAIRRTRQAGGRIVAVGSTTVRTLETVALEHGGVLPASGRSTLFIRPPFEFRVVGAMLTNFHLPRSTLLMMVSALAGHDCIMAAYAEAIRKSYRFYSYGDCMLILGDTFAT
ncbi:MAG: tRNA preQ1(34) S-adenosylmethionine ribosyltransferase-isomerase QueA [Lentisphaerae bacterium RIFOXYC12_FULL_60_16]|nr:MAG: tRNA preQ1(34) S-adenosylmethionine ribosyltransferase-isomerase QueA [Lentisphaerae bacterium RIFOXYC12_FULL_60_16]OGV83849.1 MAG: tRNA preQ1(34) S-adenosylmethionine ribosyltransferase-isomerase QueA [Lentisphaerae bacterium RIFOXYB12_FULL_60_10]